MKSTKVTRKQKDPTRDSFDDDSGPIKGTFGVMFIPPERRLKPDSQKLYWETIEADIKSRVEPINPSMNKLYQSLGNRYAVGILSPLIADSFAKQSHDWEVSKAAAASSVLSLHSEKRYPLDSGLLTSKSRMQSIEDGDDYSVVDSIAKQSQMTSIEESKANFRKKVDQPLRTTEALQLQDRLSGGKYYSPKVAEPYEPAFQAAPTVLSSFNMNTPKMWPAETQYTKSKKRNQCYESHVSPMPSTHTFGRQAYSTTLKSSLVTEDSQLRQSPSHPLPSGNMCSKAFKHVLQRGSQKLDSLNISHESDDDSYSEISQASHKHKPGKVAILASKSLSSLQHALVQCGKLSVADAEHEDLQNKRVQKSVAGQKKRLMSHANWLKHRISGQVVGDDDTIASTGDFLSTHQDKISNLRDLKRRPSSHSANTAAADGISSVGSRTATSVRTTNSSNIYKRYDQELAEHLAIPNPNVSLNPFRPTESKNMQISHNAKPPNALRPTDYRHGLKVKELGSYSVCLKPAKMIQLNDIPSRDEVNESLTILNRGMTLSYDTRIVETGALLKALQDMKHPTPGLAAIVDLNRRFVDAACMNPNQWMLNRRQLMGVIAAKTPWLEKDVIARLISAYDPQHSGIIRFIRISVSLLCCTNPAMTSLMNMFQKIALKKEAKKQRAQILHGSRHSETGKNYNHDHSLHGLSHADEDASVGHSHSFNSVLRVDKKYESVLFLIRLIHGIYEDCDGGNQLDIETQESKGVGMRLDDIVEAFSCCASCIEDEIKMARLLEPMIQALFVNGQRGDIIHFNNPNSSISGNLHNADLGRGDSLEDTETVSMLSMGADTRASFQSQNNLSRAAASLQLGGNSIAWKSLSSTVDGDYIHKKDGSLLTKNIREPRASVILKHSLLKTTRVIPRVTVDELVEIVQSYIPVLDEFYSQLHRFRGLIAPYAKQGSITYERSVVESLSYGTKDASNRSLLRRPM